MTPYLDPARCIYACYLKSQISSSSPPSDCNLESVWSCQVDLHAQGLGSLTFLVTAIYEWYHTSRHSSTPDGRAWSAYKLLLLRRVCGICHRRCRCERCSRFDPEGGAEPPPGPAVGAATRTEAKDNSTQTPPLLSSLGLKRVLDHGVRDLNCDHCKRALSPLHKHKIKSNRHLPVFTFDFSGPHPHHVNAAQYLLVCVWSSGDMR